MSSKKQIPNLSPLPRESLVELINELYKKLPEAKFLIDLRLGGSATPLVKKFKKRIANQLAIGIDNQLTIGLLDTRESLNEFSGFSPPIIREHHLTGRFLDRCKILGAEFYEIGYDFRDVTSDVKDGFKDQPL